MGLSRLVALKACRRRPRRPLRIGRMAERSTGKDSVTGHWELMGIVLDRPFPTFPHGFPAGADRRVRNAHRPQVDRQRRRVGHRDHRRARPASTWRPGFPIVYTSADSVFQIAAHEGIVPVPQLYEWCEVGVRTGREGPGAGPGHRAAVHRPARLVPAHAESPRLRHAADRGDAARSARRGGPPGDVGRQGLGPVCRPRHLGVESDQERRRRHRRDRGADGDAGARPDLREPRRLRRGLRASQRHARLCGQPRAVRRAAGRAAAEAARTTICW